MTLLGLLAGAARADVSAELQAKLDAQFPIIEQWAADPVVVAAVRERNVTTPPEFAALNQDAWTDLDPNAPVVRSLAGNPVGLILRGHRSELYTEAFVSAADGTKVGFIAKTTNWSHLGKAKHDVPMKGRRWQGVIERDASTGLQQIQIAVPVLDDGKPIGSLVVGLSVSGLARTP